MRYNLSLPPPAETPADLLFEAQGAAFLFRGRLTRYSRCRAAADGRPRLSQSVLSTSDEAFIPRRRLCDLPLYASSTGADPAIVANCQVHRRVEKSDANG